MTAPKAPHHVAPGSRRRSAGAWNWLLVVPFIGTLVPQFYNHAEPSAWGIPYFYWYQLLWVGVGVATTITVYRRTREGGR